MLLFKFQRADSSFTNFNGDFIKGFALSLSGDPATGETNKYKQIENEGNKKCPAKMMLRPTPELLKGGMISCCNQSEAERNVCPVKRGLKVLIIERVITKKSRCFNLNDFD